MSYLVFVFCFILLASGVVAQPSNESVREPVRFDPSFSAWGRVLARCATPRGFRYELLLRDFGDFNRQLVELATVSPEQFDSFTPDLQLALLINAHNMHAVDRVIKNYPVDSIEDTKRGWRSALKEKSIFLFGRKWSLKGLRDKIMEGPYRDSRAIFLLNWASKGCAPLVFVPATELNLETLMERQTREFVRNTEYQYFSPRRQRFYASPLLKQYRKDFQRDFTTLLDFLRRYLTEKEAGYLRSNPPALRFIKFDRSLNQLPDFDSRIQMGPTEPSEPELPSPVLPAFGLPLPEPPLPEGPEPEPPPLPQPPLPQPHLVVER